MQSLKSVIQFKIIVKLVLLKLTFNLKGSGTKCLKYQPFDVIKMREIREEKWERKSPKKRWISPYFYDVTWLFFETLCKVTMKGIFSEVG